MSRSETEVFLACYRFLEDRGWDILGGEAPGGSAHIPRIEIHDPSERASGSAGSRKVDLIAHRDGTILLLELKPTFSPDDVRKLDSLVRFPSWRYALVDAFEQRHIFERFNLPDSIRTRIIDGSGLQPAIGVGGGPVDIPPNFAGLVMPGDEVRAWVEPDATLQSLRR